VFKRELGGRVPREVAVRAPRGCGTAAGRPIAPRWHAAAFDKANAARVDGARPGERDDDVVAQAAAKAVACRAHRGLIRSW